MNKKIAVLKRTKSTEGSISFKDEQEDVSMLVTESDNWKDVIFIPFNFFWKVSTREMLKL